MLAEAERLNNRKAVDKLRAIGRPPPYPVSSLFRERFWVNRLQGQTSTRASWTSEGCFCWAGVVDLGSAQSGPVFRFTLNAMSTETSNVNLMKLVPALQMPVFFFLGRHDRWVPPEISVAYFNMLTAPSKTLAWFDESGHEPFVDEADKFNASMADLVRPVAG